MGMLILTRRAGESLMIGDDVTVKVLSVDGKQVKIGVGAPNEVAVHREEVYNRIAAERAAQPLAVGGADRDRDSEGGIL